MAAASTPGALRGFVLTLEEAWRRLLHRIQQEASLSQEDEEALRHNASQLLEAVFDLPAPRQPQQVAPLLVEASGCMLLPPAAQQALTHRLLQRLDPAHFQRVLRLIHHAVGRERRFQALVSSEGGLSHSLYVELERLGLFPHHLRLYLQLAYEARVTSAAGAVGQHRVHLALGAGRSQEALYVNICLDPQDSEALQAARAPLRALLEAELASAPGGATTGPEGRTCLLLVVHGQELPPQVGTELAEHRSWAVALDFYEQDWGLPPREVGACLVAIGPDW